MSERPMTLKDFRKLKPRDFTNGAVLDEIERTIQQRDQYLRDTIRIKETLPQLILSSWDAWEVEAEQEAARAQDSDVWDFHMEASIENAIQRILDKP